jgi:hypothetical protein
MAVVLAVLGLAGGRDAAATTIAAAEAHESGAAGDHLCKCKTCRGASSCCCSHARADAPASAPAHATAKRPAPSPGKPAVPDAGPCVDSAPCGGGEGTPASPTGVTTGKIATLSSPARLSPAANDQPLALGDPSGLPETVPSRLDEPPESSSRS